MDLPPEYGIQGTLRKVSQLCKALYRLKQSPHAWFGQFTQAMKRYGYR